MEPAEIYQMEGFDPRRRMFNRNVFIYKKNRNYAAQFSYEEIFLESSPYPTPAEALTELAQTLQSRSFANLRGRLNFKGKKYLTELEPWVEF